MINKKYKLFWYIFPFRNMLMDRLHYFGKYFFVLVFSWIEFFFLICKIIIALLQNKLLKLKILL